MLTEDYLKDNFIDAYFIDEERQNIEVLTTSEDKKSVMPTIIPFSEDNHMFIALKSVMTVDQLHERTYQKKKDERKLFEEKVLEIAKKDGLLISNNETDKDYWPKLIDSVLNNSDNEDHLFALKLALFEVDKIRDSENTELKGAIRKGKTKAEVLLNALKIILA